MALSDYRPVGVVDLVERVAVPADADAVKAEVEAVAVAAQAVEDPAPRALALPSIWGGWAPRERTVVREAEDGVVGGGRTATVWKPEFRSLFD